MIKMYFDMNNEFHEIFDRHWYAYYMQSGSQMFHTIPDG